MTKLVQSRETGLVITRTQIIPDIRCILEIQDARVDLLSDAVQKPRFDHTVAMAPYSIISSSGGFPIAINEA